MELDPFSYNAILNRGYTVFFNELSKRISAFAPLSKEEIFTIITEVYVDLCAEIKMEELL